MTQKKNNTKALILAGVVLFAALIGFLIYDEVKAKNTVKELNEILANTQSIQVGNIRGESFSYDKEAGKEASTSKMKRESDFARSENSITFRELSTDMDTGEMVSHVYLRPGEYYMIADETDKWALTRIEENIDARPYSMGPTARPVIDADYKRIHKTTVDGKEAFELSLSGQWLMTNYMGGAGKPLEGHIFYIVGEQDGKKIIEETRRTMEIRVMDMEGNKSIQVLEENSYFEGHVALDGGNPVEELQQFYKDNIENNYEEPAQEQQETPAESEEVVPGESGEAMESTEEVVPGESEEKPADAE